MASPVLVVRAGVGPWTAIKYVMTRGLDFPAATPVRQRRTLSTLGTRAGDRQVQGNNNG